MSGSKGSHVLLAIFAVGGLISCRGKKKDEEKLALASCESKTSLGGSCTQYRNIPSDIAEEVKNECTSMESAEGVVITWRPDIPCGDDYQAMDSCVSSGVGGDPDAEIILYGSGMEEAGCVGGTFSKGAETGLALASCEMGQDWYAVCMEYENIPLVQVPAIKRNCTDATTDQTASTWRPDTPCSEAFKAMSSCTKTSDNSRNIRKTVIYTAVFAEDGCEGGTLRKGSAASAANPSAGASVALASCETDRGLSKMCMEYRQVPAVTAEMLRQYCLSPEDDQEYAGTWRSDKGCADEYKTMNTCTYTGTNADDPAESVAYIAAMNEMGCEGGTFRAGSSGTTSSTGN